MQYLIMDVCIGNSGTYWFKCVKHLTTLVFLTCVSQCIVSKWNFLSGP